MARPSLRHSSYHPPHPFIDKDHTMSLEAQGRSQEEKAQEIEELAAEMVRTMSRELWEEML